MQVPQRGEGVRALQPRDVVMLFMKGAAMGAAEVVPGVSGGTIAFITGIYERLLRALRQCNPTALALLWREGIVSAWRFVDGTFLVVLFGGMAVSILTLARILSHLLANYPVSIWAFFFGLIVASCVLVGATIGRWSFDVVGSAVAGTTIGVIVTMAVPIELEATPLSLFAGGAVAVCAWILPGLSGSFILLILGLYVFVLDAIEKLNLVLLGALAAGCITGLLLFSRVLSFLLQRFREQTLGLLTGFMAGSLYKVWPWKHTLSYQMGADGEQFPLAQDPVAPSTYFELTGLDPQLLTACLFAAIGGASVLLLHRLAGK